MKPLSEFPLSLKVFATCVILTQLLGYAVALVQVYDRSHFDMQQTVAYYNGDGLGDASVLLPQTFATILSVTHAHAFSQPFIFACVGLIFCFSGLTEKKKACFIALGFGGTVISNFTPWLIRYAHGGFVYLYPFSQTLIAISLLTMCGVSLKQMWCPCKN